MDPANPHVFLDSTSPEIVYSGACTVASGDANNTVGGSQHVCVPTSAVDIKFYGVLRSSLRFASFLLPCVLAFVRALISCRSFVRTFLASSVPMCCVMDLSVLCCLFDRWMDGWELTLI
jgi:hypothetical protein